MPPKRKSKGVSAKAGGKKVKKELEEVSTESDVISKLKAADAGRKKTFKVDSFFPVPGAQVYADYDCMLNQTNIGSNNNKYYVIQVIHIGKNFYAWNRWGRVGENGANSLKGPVNENDAVSDFKKKFKDKTKNDWDKRDNFTPKAGKYVLLDMCADDDDDEQPSVDVVDSATKTVKKVLPSKLNKPTQALMKLIFDHDMFKEAMANFEIDVKKMPLGKISKTQIAKGFEVLEEIEKTVNEGKSINLHKLHQLSSSFYTLIPHAFGRQVPPTIRTAETVRQKMDMLLVLGDIELAQSMEKSAERSVDDKTEIPNPMDTNYDLLNCDLDLLTKQDKEYKVIEKYLLETRGHFKLDLLDVWKVSRKGEEERFKAHDKLGNRKLLWHGTNVAVVAAILKSGLRIMPHSGGRVGQGIYFASENMKSACYVRPAGKTGIMFLNEVALGKEHHITVDDSRLKKAPSGHDSVIAKGRTEPDCKFDTEIKLDGKKVTVPQGKPISQKEFADSQFGQSEYLIYNESQCRMRYLLKLRF